MRQDGDIRVSEVKVLRCLPALRLQMLVSLPGMLVACQMLLLAHLFSDAMNMFPLILQFPGSLMIFVM